MGFWPPVMCRCAKPLTASGRPALRAVKLGATGEEDADIHRLAIASDRADDDIGDDLYIPGAGAPTAHQSVEQGTAILTNQPHSGCSMCASPF